MLHLRGRMLSSMEATWRIFNYPLYPATTPPVTTIKSKSKSQMIELKKNRKTCMMEVYFHRSPFLEELTYIEFCKLFDYALTQNLIIIVLLPVKLKKRFNLKQIKYEFLELIKRYS